MIRVYLSQPMSGLDISEIEDTYEASLEYIKMKHDNCEVKITNGYNEDWENLLPLDAVGKSLEILAHSDMAYFAPGWEKSKGCQIEAMCCDLYNIPYASLPYAFPMEHVF